MPDPYDVGPGSQDLPPPFGQGPPLSDEAVRVNTTLGAWNRLGRAFGTGLPAATGKAVTLTKHSNRLLGLKG